MKTQKLNRKAEESISNARARYSHLDSLAKYVDGITDRLGTPIEPKIKPLVIALNYKGYRTTASCQGHSLKEWEDRIQRIHGDNAQIIFRAKRGLVYKIKEKDGEVKEYGFNENPWIDIKMSDNQLISLSNTIKDHNKRTGIYWRTTQFAKPVNQYRIETIPRYNFTVMQSDITKLAEDILKLGQL